MNEKIQYRVESKFKVGDEIYFMKYGTPTKGKIDGVLFCVGTINDYHLKLKENSDGAPSVSYSSKDSLIDERMAFGTVDELKDNLFKELI